MMAVAARQFVRRWEYEWDEPIRDAVPSPDATCVAVASVEGPIVLIDATGTAVHRLRGHELGTKSVAWTPDAADVVSCGQDGTAAVCRRADGFERARVRIGAPWGERVAVAPDGKTFATAAGRSVRLWSLDGDLLCEWPERSSTVLDIAWKPRAKHARLAAASYGSVGLYDPRKHDRASRELSWKGSSLVLAWSPDGTYLATGDQDASVHLWVVKTGRDLMMAGYPRKVRELAWSRTGRWLATGGGHQVIVWDCSRSPEGTAPVVLEHHEAPLCALAFQRRGNLLASASADGKLAVWEPSVSREPVASLADIDDAAVAALAWTTDDDLLVARRDGRITAWRALRERNGSA
jgi:WD40 repeat protein